MPLSANANLKRVSSPFIKRSKLVDGLIHVFRHALLAYEAGNIGYVKLGSDTLGQTFAGIATEEVNWNAAENPTDGTKEVEVWTPGCNEVFLLPVRSTITIANEGQAVYLDGDDYVDIASGITNTTNGQVGIIREFVSANLAYVQLT